MINGYLAVGNKCAVNFEELGLPLSREESIKLLWKKGFREVNIDVVELARKCISFSRYKRGAPFFQAPNTLDCSTLTKWVYAKAGIWLPRHSIDQREMGIEVYSAQAGDLIFTKGAKAYWDKSVDEGVGHVGICADSQTVIHAASRTRGVVEEDISKFVDSEDFRGIRRIKTSCTVILESPSNRVIEWSGELRNILAQGLG